MPDDERTPTPPPKPSPDSKDSRTTGQTGAPLRHHPLLVWDPGSMDIRKALAALVEES